MNTVKANCLALLIGLCLAVWASTTRADNPLPPVPEGGLMQLAQTECTDAETGEAGYCYMTQDMRGNIYVLFTQDGEAKFIRQVIGDGYITVWAAAQGVLM